MRLFTRCPPAVRRRRPAPGPAAPGHAPPARAPARGLVGDPHEQRQDDVVGHQRGAAEGHERQGHAGEGQHPDDAADDEERLTPIASPSRWRGVSRRGCRFAARCASGPDEQHERRQDGGPAQQAELLADDREDEVGLPCRDACRVAEPRPGAGDASRSQAERRLHHLEPGGLGHRPGIEPDRHPLPHVGEQLIGDRRADREHHHAHEQVGGPLGRHPHHHDEQREEQQRRPEVLLGDHHQDGDPPCGEKRAQVLGSGSDSGPTLSDATASSSRRSTRYDARNRASSSWRARRAGS